MSDEDGYYQEEYAEGNGYDDGGDGDEVIILNNIYLLK